MIFRDEIKDLVNKKVRFTVSCGGNRKILEGKCIGASGSDATVLVIVDGEVHFPSLKDVYKEGDEVPDEGCEEQYRIVMYESRITDMHELINFALLHPVMTDKEARKAYISSARRLAGFKMEIS